MAEPTDNSYSPSDTSTNNPKVVDGKLEKRRAISDAGQAQKISDGIVQDDIGRDRRRASIQRALNGGAPYSSKTLEEKNQSHRFNVSFGYLEGACGRAYAPYLDLGLDEEFVAKINADLPENKKNIIRDEFVKAVRRWGKWGYHYNRLVQEVINFGYCTAVFPSPHSPWWYSARQREGLTFARSPNITADLDLFIWRRSYLIHELYDHVADKEAAEAAGWKIENVYNAMAAAAPDDYTQNRLIGNLQVFEEAVRAAALYLSYGRGAKKVKVYHVYCAELDGKVTNWTVLDTSSSHKATAEPPSDNQILLFYQEEQFKNMDEVVVRFDLEYGDGYWHGSKGLAQKLFSIHGAHDRLMNTGLDQTFRSGLGILQSANEKAHNANSLMVSNDFVFLPPDCKAEPGVKMPGLQQSFFSMDAALLASAVQRGGDVAPEAMGVERQEKTATQSTFDQASKQIITKANLKRWVPPLSNVIDKMLRRLLNAESGDPDAQVFVQRLTERGITPEDIQKIQKVEVFHTVEDVFGETKQNISYISDKYRGDPDINRIELKQREVGIWLGPQASLELVPGNQDELDALKASRLQILEISSILDGNTVPVSPSDLHKVHAQTIINYIKDDSDRLIAGQTSDRRTPNDQDIVNVTGHAEEHIAMEGSKTGNRDSARALEASLKEVLDLRAKAVQFNQMQHAEAMETGIKTALIEDAQTPSVEPESQPAAPTPQEPAPTL